MRSYILYDDVKHVDQKSQQQQSIIFTMLPDRHILII